jgi:release factor glutamine methyltransferase
MTLREALTEATTQIARRDAEILLAHLLSRDRVWTFANRDADILPSDLEGFRILVARRAAHEPLQYLTGTQDFFGLTLNVTPDTLIPRPETELLVEAVLHWITSRPRTSAPRLPLRILDVGTGTGAIALALAARLPTGSITATDISPPTLAVAQDNADRLGLAHRIVFILSDLLDELAPQLNQGHPFNIIVSNPPYVPSTDAPLLQPEVVHHEPHTALFAGPTGLDIYRRLIPQARSALSPAGLLALEFGFGQREPLTELLKGWRNIRFIDDYAGIPRVALAIRP